MCKNIGKKIDDSDILTKWCLVSNIFIDWNITNNGVCNNLLAVFNNELDPYIDVLDKLNNVIDPIVLFLDSTD